jgi:hypothetical protein
MKYSIIRDKREGFGAGCCHYEDYTDLIVCIVGLIAQIIDIAREHRLLGVMKCT